MSVQLDAAREKNREKCRRWYAANKERQKEKARRQYAESPEQKRASTKRWRAANPEKAQEYTRRWRLGREFGITPEEYDRLLAAQGYGCAICGVACSTGKRLAVDHDHETGRVRGLLCFRCNRGVGQFGDNPERLLSAATYLSGS